MKVNFISYDRLSAEETNCGSTYLICNGGWANAVVIRLTISPAQFVVLNGSNAGELLINIKPEIDFKPIEFELQEVPL